MTNTPDENRPVSDTPDESEQPGSLQPGAEPAASPVIEEMVIPEKSSPRRRRGCLRIWMLWVVAALLLLFTIAGISGWAGYRDANRLRNQNAIQNTAAIAQTQFAVAMQEIDAGSLRLLPTRLASFREWPSADRTLSPDIAMELQVQFQLAQADVNEKRYDEARARLDWIIEWNPAYPGVTDLLAEAIYQASITATPTLAPTLTPVPPTPTQDTRDVDKMFSDAQQAYIGGNWSLAIDTMLTLRKRDPAYKAVQIDDMMYVSLRNRGMDEIKGSGKTDPTITQVDLEGGMYDLRLAETYGPLDADAQKYRRWAQWYIAGASFWNVDWKRAADYFAMVANEAPYLVDVNAWPAIERYRFALVKYGDQLVAAGDCAGASEQYAKALALGPNPELAPTATAAAEGCGPKEPKNTPKPVGQTPVVPPGQPTSTQPPAPPPGEPTSTQPPAPPPAATPTPTPRPPETTVTNTPPAPKPSNTILP